MLIQYLFSIWKWKFQVTFKIIREVSLFILRESCISQRELHITEKLLSLNWIFIIFEKYTKYTSFTFLSFKLIINRLFSLMPLVKWYNQYAEKTWEGLKSSILLNKILSSNSKQANKMLTQKIRKALVQKITKWRQVT